MNLKEMDRQKGYLRTVECIKNYTFNKTDTFQGIRFIKGVMYEANIHDVADYNLYGIYNDDIPVGMSTNTFNKHFKFKEDSNE